MKIMCGYLLYLSLQINLLTLEDTASQGIMPTCNDIYIRSDWMTITNYWMLSYTFSFIHTKLMGGGELLHILQKLSKFTKFTTKDKSKTKVVELKCSLMSSRYIHVLVASFPKLLRSFIEPRVWGNVDSSLIFSLKFHKKRILEPKLRL
jgi:hypothetical protein